MEKAYFLIFFQIFWGLVPGLVSWVLGIVCWVSGIVFWVLGFVFWVSGFVFWVSGLVFWVLGLVFCVLGLVFWVSGLVFWHFFEYLAPSGAKYREKGWAASKTGEGPSANPFWDF